jgi:hypothetical protein
LKKRAEIADLTDKSFEDRARRDKKTSTRRQAADLAEISPNSANYD